jgi:hypothetical protein
VFALSKPAFVKGSSSGEELICVPRRSGADQQGRLKSRSGGSCARSDGRGCLAEATTILSLAEQEKEGLQVKHLLYGAGLGWRGRFRYQ